MDIEQLGNRIIGSAIEVHKTIGPGLLESIYERCLMEELKLQGIKCRQQVLIPLYYKEINLESAYAMDLVVDDEIVLELKTVEALNNLHVAQLLTYLRLSNLRVGYLINFNSYLLKNGIRRIENNL
jgi:GxxExxY protein